MPTDRKDPVALTFDQGKVDKLQAFLFAMERAGPRVVARGINKILQLWAAMIKRHAPVDDGLYRASITVDPATPNNIRIRGQVGSNVIHALYLEFGTDKQRGYMFQVFKWKQGDEPVTRWYAKDGPLAQLLDNRDAEKTASKRLAMNAGLARLYGRGVKEQEQMSKKAASAMKRYQRLSKHVQKGFDPGSEEFGPPFRASWDKIIDDALSILRDEVAMLMRSGEI